MDPLDSSLPSASALHRPRLEGAALSSVPAEILKPGYPLASVELGVVHLGPGSFHRAHQAWYFEKLLTTDRRWGICGVSLQSATVRDALFGQQNLYTLAIRDEHLTYQIIGALREMLVAREDPDTVLNRLCAPTTRIVTLTVTEKGYRLTGDGDLNFADSDIQNDIANPHRPVTPVGFITQALARRRQAGLAPFAVISCDNLLDNGVKLRRSVVQLAGETDRDLARWIEGEVPFPRTMVDSITPATTAALKASVTNVLGHEDHAPVQRESFAQWVMEDTVSGPGWPRWAEAGITLTGDVAAYDRAKLRLLNGAHSTLAYVGLLAGHETVATAIADPHLFDLVNALMTEDVLPTLNGPRGFDLHAYVASILGRFRNPGIRHVLTQIAMDGSQKLPLRILTTLQDALLAGRPVDRLCVPIAAWMRYVRRCVLNRDRIDDPLAPALVEIGKRTTGSAERDVPLFLGAHGMFPDSLRAEPRFVVPLQQLYDGAPTAEVAIPVAIRALLRRAGSP